MAMLHIIRSSGFTSNALTQCLNMTLPEDTILLMDDGCYNLNHPVMLETQSNQQQITVYYISLHASARAQINKSSFTAIGLDDVPDLIFKHDNAITWS
jgi:tRNA 2-thiouridine synthesizing protein B